MRALLWSFVLAPLLWSSVALGQEYRCPDQPKVWVAAAKVDTVEDICSATGQAIRYLARYQLTPKRAIRFNIVEEKIDIHGFLAYGSYDSRKDVIQLMSFPAIIRGAPNPRMYGEPFDQVHYRGAIAHEVTHAIFQHHAQQEQVSTAPQEYLATSIQLAMLPKERREQIIQAMGVGAWESGDTISDAYLAIQPGKFAVKSYLHLNGLTEPMEFIHLLLNAKWFYIHVP
jgi:hypothetical protein